MKTMMTRGHKALLAFPDDPEIIGALLDVVRVFGHGEEKHGDDWKDTSYLIHLAHARTHLFNANELGPVAKEIESGLPELAHAATRCILALAMIKRGAQ